MKTEGEEFQCSDCGAVVPSDSTLCPNCGASLEETSSEEEFVEIPLTSDPSKLSSILSILDEKKIEYSINENAIENVWGPTFSQVPSLLISSNLADEVNEIIDSIEEEEIEVFEELPDNENQVTNIQREEIKGVEGYRLLCRVFRNGYDNKSSVLKFKIEFIQGRHFSKTGAAPY